MNRKIWFQKPLNDSLPENSLLGRLRRFPYQIIQKLLGSRGFLHFYMCTFQIQEKEPRLRKNGHLWIFVSKDEDKKLKFVKNKFKATHFKTHILFIRTTLVLKNKFIKTLSIKDTPFFKEQFCKYIETQNWS